MLVKGVHHYAQPGQLKFLSLNAEARTLSRTEVEAGLPGGASCMRFVYTSQINMFLDTYVEFKPENFSSLLLLV